MKQQTQLAKLILGMMARSFITAITAIIIIMAIAVTTTIITAITTAKATKVGYYST